MLDVDGATSFLLARGLIDTGWIVDGHLTIRSEARRNRNLRVEGPAGKGFLIKQPDDPGHGGHSTLRNEATFHRFCRQEPAVSSLARFIPHLIDCDQGTARLVFELVTGAVSFQSKLEEKANGETMTAAARELGKGLAILHRCFRPECVHADDRLSELARHPPWATGLHKPAPELLAVLSAANYETLRILQTQEGLGERLDRLRRDWRPETVIHGDVKFDNVLVRTDHDGESPTSTRIWIVDWEMVQIGDPAWDVAGAFQDFLVLWVRSMPMNEEMSPEERIAGARQPLGELRDAIRALWEGYRVIAELGHHESDRFLQRCVVLSAARLMQSAYEIGTTAAHLTGSAVLLLQIAANVLAEPRRGQVQLYGIPWRTELS
jgi:aminoglycoside phosphotransferase (APT) family kinase protein